MDCSPLPELLYPWNSQTRILEWAAIPFFRFSQPSDQSVSPALAGKVLHHCASWEARCFTLDSSAFCIGFSILGINYNSTRPFIIRTVHVFHVSFVELPVAHTLPSWAICFQPQPIPTGTLPSTSLCALSSLPGYWKALSLPSFGRPSWLLTGSGAPTLPFRIAYTHRLIGHCAASTPVSKIHRFSGNIQEGQAPCLCCYCIHTVWPNRLSAQYLWNEQVKEQMSEAGREREKAMFIYLGTALLRYNFTLIRCTIQLFLVIYFLNQLILRVT